jgi:alpha-1,3-rhamnosyl/mannosyltransferase
LAFLADQLGGASGGGRFVTQYLRHLLKDPDGLAHLEHLLLVVTRDEPIHVLDPLPANVRVLQRRFPSRLRGTRIASLYGSVLPAADVFHGPFYYAFPGHRARTVVTFHDLSPFDARFHPAQRRVTIESIQASVRRADALVCDSDSIAAECRTRWPEAAAKVVRIYPGAEPLTPEPGEQRAEHRPAPYLLAVGTIEPRKNVDVLLDAYERLRVELQDEAPALILAGRAGWMCTSACQRLRTLQARGYARWLEDAADEQLASLYAEASLFTYLSVYEGFGYPPFEAAFAGVPMVLTNQSSVGEIWRGHARCVDPLNVAEIVAAWKWALGLGAVERAEVVTRQRARAAEFSWDRCIQAHVDLYWRLAGESLSREGDLARRDTSPRSGTETARSGAHDAVNA